MANFVIRQDNPASVSPAWHLVAEAYAVLIDLEHTPETGGFPVNWDDELLYAVDPGDQDVVGVIAFRELKHEGSLFVLISYVEPSSRRSGCFKAMWEALIAEARKRKVLRIEGVTHVDNAEMRAVNSKLGRTVVMLQTSFRIE